jgi:hypothetical protein
VALANQKGSACQPIAAPFFVRLFSMDYRVKPGGDERIERSRPSPQRISIMPQRYLDDFITMPITRGPKAGMRR